MRLGCAGLKRRLANPNLHKCTYTLLMVKDSNGNTLQDGDSVMVIKDLKVKGGTDLKRGKVFKNIRISEDAEDSIEVKDGRGTLVLKTMYLKKA